MEVAVVLLTLQRYKIFSKSQLVLCHVPHNLGVVDLTKVQNF